MQETIGTAAQDFWLDKLGVAHRFNAWVFSCFRRYLGRNVLEVGCGSGNFTTLMAAGGHKVTGCDLHAPYVDIARARLADYPAAEAAEKAAEEDVQDRAADLTAMLPVALRLSQYPAETLLAAPEPPETVGYRVCFAVAKPAP